MIILISLNGETWLGRIHISNGLTYYKKYLGTLEEFLKLNLLVL